MCYLTFEEFKGITGKSDEFEVNFYRFYPKAEAVLDHITNRFYQFSDIKNDRIAFRVNQFKKALCSQIVFFDEMDADTFEGVNKTPQTVTIGATISNSSRYNAGGANESKALVAEDIYIYLEGTGLLYRGCGT